MPTTIRLATVEDADGIGRVSRATGQLTPESGADPRYVALLASIGRIVVAVDDTSAIAGWAAVRAIPYGNLISDLFVRPDSQGRGLGRALLDALIGNPARAAGTFTFSSQHPAALPLYARAGLVPSWPLLYVCGETTRLARRLVVHKVGASQAAEAEAALTDAPARFADYRFWADKPGGSGVIVRSAEGCVAAGALGSSRVKHLTCVDALHATEALLAAAASVSSSPVRLCLPGAHPALPTLLSVGFRIEDLDIAMLGSSVALPGHNAYHPGLG